MRGHSCTALILWLLSVAGAAGAEPKSATTNAASLRVQVELEDTEFLEGQSIYAVFTARNAGRDSLRGIPPLAPAYGFTRLELLDGTGNRVPCIMSSAGRYVGSGRSLGPGELFCEVRDLSLYFGDLPASPTTIAGKFGFPDLPVGEYRLRWSFLPGSSGYPEITGREIQFSVRPVEVDPSEKRLLDEFMSGMSNLGPDRSALHRHARDWLPRFYGSHYLLRVYMTTGTLLNGLDFDAVFNGVTAANAPPGRRAALLGARLSMTDYSGTFTPSWKDRLRGHLGSEVERAVLTIEPRHPVPDDPRKEGER